MPAPILATKLFIPPPYPKIVLRPRLIDRLNEGLHHKLTLISAPAGFGKTTLVSEWVAGCKQPVAWLSLDEGDKDPARFLSYLIAALQTLALSKVEGIMPKIGVGILAALQNPQQSSIESLLTTLLNEINSIPDNFVLVLDDYHVIDSKPVDEALTFLLTNLPPQMHLVITTREDPHLPLPRLRARGQLTELRAVDMRFTPTEAAEFLNQVMGLNLSAENIAALEARTEGWIAGLQLAALSMQGRQDTAGFIKSFTGSHYFVLDYLVEEVLKHQSELIRSFLLQTSILDRLCAPLCNAVTGREDAKEMLKILEHNNLFLIPLDDERQWYRYHHLFADVLRAHLIEAQPGQVSRLHQRASWWYEQNGFPPDAIRHALAANDFEQAAGLIELAWPAAEEGSIQPAAWLAWVKALPDNLVLARPVLSVCYAYALLGIGEIEAAESRLKDAEQWLQLSDTLKVQPEIQSVEMCPESSRRMVVADQEQFKSLPAAIAVGHAYIAQTYGNIPDTVRYARLVLELVPEGDSYRRKQASMLLGMTYWASGDLEAADRVFADYTMRLRADGNIPDAIGSTVVLADIRSALGHLREAIGTSEQLLQFVMDHVEPMPSDTADLHRKLSELYLERFDLESAAQHLRISKELGEKAELPVWRYRWYFSQARFNETRGDLDGALELLNEAEKLHIRTPLPDLYPIAAMKARIWVAQGRLIQALEWVREQGLSPADDLGYLREFEHTTLAMILIAQYRNDRMDDSIHSALNLLDRLLQAAEEGSRMGSLIEILVLQALAHQARGNITSALLELERALTIAEPEGYVSIFVDGGKPMAELLNRFKAKDGTHRVKEYSLKLLSAFNMQKELHPFGSTHLEKNKPSSSSQPLIEPLSERELEVLRLLRSELTGPEIARDRMVSLSTIRTHTQNIYAKLGVNNRRAAVRRAEELDLI
jgi:LuxR family transcriptional regulator, maltose regulon positive regulatory protein